MSTKEELLKRLSEGVLEMEEDDVAEAAQEYIDAGYPALDAINQGLIDGMNQASELFEEEEYFVTDLLLCSGTSLPRSIISKPAVSNIILTRFLPIS